MQVLRRFEAAVAGNLCNGRIGFFQTVGGGGQFEAQDFVVHAAAALFAKVRLQRYDEFFIRLFDSKRNDTFCFTEKLTEAHKKY